MSQQSSGFWSSLPGILTGIAAIITAVTGLYIAISIHQGGGGTDDVGSPKEPQPVIKDLSGQIGADGASTTSEVDTASNAANGSAKSDLADSSDQTLVSDLVDCQWFPSVNTVKSLMSWSNYYHQKILDAQTTGSSVESACVKTIDYRAQAHCQQPANLQVRQGLFETLSLCRTAGIDWKAAVKRP